MLFFSKALLLLVFLLVSFSAITKCEEAPARPNNTGVRLHLSSELRDLPSYSIIHGAQFYDIDNDNDGIVDALWCQSSDPQAVGVWYYPNGTQIPEFDGEFGNMSAPRPLFAKVLEGQVALARRAGLAGYEGLYKCIIPDEDGVNQTLVVGAYKTNTYKANEGPLLSLSVTYTLISVVPLHVSLSFNVSRGPPTVLNCSVNDTIPLSSFTRSVLDGPRSVTGVKVAVRERHAGLYKCIVSNDRVINATANRLILARSASTSIRLDGVAESPWVTEANIKQTGPTTVQISWYHKVIVGAPYRYEVFQSYDNTIKSVFNTSDCVASISGLSPGANYTFFVIAISLNTSSVVLLPSEPSAELMIVLVINETSSAISPSATAAMSSFMESSANPSPSATATMSSFMDSSANPSPSATATMSSFMESSANPSQSSLTNSTLSSSITQSVTPLTPGNVGGGSSSSSVGLTAGIIVLSVLAFILIVLVVVLVFGLVAIYKKKPKKGNALT